MELGRAWCGGPDPAHPVSAGRAPNVLKRWVVSVGVPAYRKETMSFRWKVRLLFLGAVLVPLAAIGVVLIALQEQSRHAQASSELSQGLQNFHKLYLAAREGARDDARLAVEDPVLTQALASGNLGLARSRLARLLHTDRDIVSASLYGPDDRRLAGVGSKHGFAHQSVRIRAPDGRILGTLAISVTDARRLAREAAEGTDLELLALRDGRVVGGTIPVRSAELSRGNEGDLTAAGGEGFRSRRLTTGSIAGVPEEITALQRSTKLESELSEDRVLIAGLLILFFAIAAVSALLVVRGVRRSGRRIGLSADWIDAVRMHDKERPGVTIVAKSTTTAARQKPAVPPRCEF